MGDLGSVLRTTTLVQRIEFHTVTSFPSLVVPLHSIAFRQFFHALAFLSIGHQYRNSNQTSGRCSERTSHRSIVDENVRTENSAGNLLHRMGTDGRRTPRVLEISFNASFRYASIWNTLAKVNTWLRFCINRCRARILMTLEFRSHRSAIKNVPRLSRRHWSSKNCSRPVPNWRTSTMPSGAFRIRMTTWGWFHWTCVSFELRECL